MLQHGDAFVALVAGDGLAVDTFGLFAEEFDERGAIGHLAFGFGQWFALLCGQDRAEVILVRHHQVEPFAQNICAFLAGPAGPFFLSGFSLGNGASHLSAAEIGHLSDHIAAGRVCYIKGAILAVHPFAADIGAGFEQAWIFEQGFEISCSVGHLGVSAF